MKKRMKKPAAALLALLLALSVLPPCLTMAADQTFYAYSDIGSGDLEYYTSMYGCSHWPGYCIDHGMRSPSTSGSGYYLTDTQIRQVGYIMKHGYPNVDWGLGQAKAQLLTQAAVEGVLCGHAAMYELTKNIHSPAYVYAACLGGPAYTEGSWDVSDEFRNAENLYQAAVADSSASDAAYVRIYQPYETNLQRMAVPVPVNEITVVKSGAWNGKSLAGAEYAVTDPDGLDAGTIKIKADGTADSLEVTKLGTYTIREIKAPQGYTLDLGVHTVNVQAGTSVSVVASKDAAKMAPVGILLQKRAAEGAAESVPSLADAQFELRFYEGLAADDPSDIPDGESGAAAVRQWIYRTDEDGILRLNEDSCKISGDDLYYDPEGNAALPEGTLVIRETEAPKGYLLNKDIFYAVLAIDDNGNCTWKCYSSSDGTASWTALGTQTAVLTEISDLDMAVPEFPVPSIAATTALDRDTGEHKGQVKAAAVIRDTVDCEGLVIGQMYQVSGRVVYKEDFTDADGVMHRAGDPAELLEGSETEKCFTAVGNEQSEELSYVVDSTKLQGASLVVYEELCFNGETLCKHEDLTDAAQTVSYPVLPKPAEKTGPQTGDSAHLLFWMLLSLAGLAAAFAAWKILMKTENKKTKRR